MSKVNPESQWGVEYYSQGGVVVDGVAYFTANDECRREGVVRTKDFPCVVAFDVNTLKRIRSYDFEFTYDSTPLVFQRRDGTWLVFAHEHKNARTVALNRDTGEVEWTSEANQPGSYFFGYSYYERDDGSKLLLMACQNGLHALSSETGEDVWWVKRRSTGGITPCVDQESGLVYYQCDEKLLKISANDGEILNEVDVPSPNRCISWNTVLVNDESGYFVATRWYGKPEWDSAIRVYDKDLSLIWERTGLPNGKKDTLTYVHGKIVCGSGNGWSKKYTGDAWKYVAAYSITDGEIVWKCDLSKFDYKSIANLPYFNGFLYAETAASPPKTSKILRIDADTGRLEEVYEYGRAITSCASHFIAHGRIFSGDLWEDGIVVTQCAENAETNWPGPFGDPQINQMRAPEDPNSKIVPLEEIALDERPHAIVAFGDSTTAPRQVDGEALRVYADVLRDYLEQEGIPSRVLNAGVGGNTTAQARARFAEDVLCHEPDLVIIQFGLNDSCIDVHKGKDTPRVPLSDYEGNVKFFVKTLRDRGASVILMTPNPMLWTEQLKSYYGKPPYDFEDPWGFNRMNQEYAGAVRKIAKEQRVPLVDVYQICLDYDRLGNQALEDLLLDGMHPNEKGHSILGELLMNQTTTMLDGIMAPGYTISTIDLADQTHRQVVVDREEGQYLGHPTTFLFEDNKTMVAVYPNGHGNGGIVMKRSEDAGLTWSERLPVPENWATSKEVPTIHRAIDSKETKRLILFSGLYPIRMAVSEDDGHTWSPLEPIGDFGGIVAMASVERLKNGNYIALFHDDGRFIHGSGESRDPRTSYVYKIVSEDGGLTWSNPVVIASHPTAFLCEPGVVRSPDGSQIAALLRENTREYNSFVIFSNDEGETWSRPRQLPAALTGDRHTGKYAPDGRLFISFRDTTRESPTKGDWVGWVGTYKDIVEGREGQYRVRLMDNHKGADCAYPGVEVLPDGTFITTTYGHWIEGEEPFIVSVRLKLEEIDALAPR